MRDNIFFFRFVLIVSILFFCGLNCIKSVKDDLSVPAGNVSYWLDSETSSVHKMITVNDKSEIVSIIRYEDGISIEVLEIIRSEIIDGKLSWAYYVPSTGYTVEMKVVSSDANRITVKWKNKNTDGGTDSGDEILIRCEENGSDLSSGNDNGFYDVLDGTSAVE